MRPSRRNEYFVPRSLDSSSDSDSSESLHPQAIDKFIQQLQTVKQDDSFFRRRGRSISSSESSSTEDSSDNDSSSGGGGSNVLSGSSRGESTPQPEPVSRSKKPRTPSRYDSGSECEDYWNSPQQSCADFSSTLVPVSARKNEKTIPVAIKKLKRQSDCRCTNSAQSDHSDSTYDNPSSPLTQLTRGLHNSRRQLPPYPFTCSTLVAQDDSAGCRHRADSRESDVSSLTHDGVAADSSNQQSDQEMSCQAHANHVAVTAVCFPLHRIPPRHRSNDPIGNPVHPPAVDTLCAPYSLSSDDTNEQLHRGGDIVQPTETVFAYPRHRSPTRRHQDQGVGGYGHVAPPPLQDSEGGESGGYNLSTLPRHPHCSIFDSETMHPQNGEAASVVRGGTDSTDAFFVRRRRNSSEAPPPSSLAPPLPRPHLFPATEDFIAWACYEPPVSVLAAMTERRIRIDRGSDDNGNTLMHMCCGMGNLSLVMFLCDIVSMHSFCVPNRLGQHPIHISCQIGHLHVVRFLSERFPPSLLTTPCSAMGWTPLHYAVSSKCPAGRAVENRSDPAAVEVTRFLLRTLPQDEIWLPDETGRNALHLACTSGSIMNVLALCAGPGADLFAHNAAGRRSLDLIAARGCVELFEELLRDDSEEDVRRILNSQNQYGSTCLHYAAKYGRIDMIYYLLKNGADVSVSDNAGLTPAAIMSSLEVECVEVMITDLDSGYEPDEKCTLSGTGGLEDVEKVKMDYKRDQRESPAAPYLDRKSSDEGKIEATNLWLMDALMQDIMTLTKAEDIEYDITARDNDGALEPVDSIRDVFQLSFRN